VAWRRKAARGRPRKADAKRRRTTVLGRAPEVDQGTAQLRARKRAVTRREDLEITGTAVLFGHDLLDRTQYDTLGVVTGLLQRIARAWGGRDGSVNGLWSAISAAASSVGFAPIPAGDGRFSLADQGRRQLERMCRCLDGSRELVIELAEGKVPEIVLHVIERTMTAADAESLERLRRSLDDIGGERRGRSRL
jgi:hypothetical protein